MVSKAEIESVAVNMNSNLSAAYLIHQVEFANEKSKVIKTSFKMTALHYKYLEETQLEC